MAGTFAEAAIKFTADDSALKGQLGNIEQTIGGASTRMASLGSQAMVAVAGIASAWMAVGKAMEYIELGAKAQQAEESFRLVAEASGIAADALIANMTRAAAGTVDDSDLMQESVKGMILGLKDNQLVQIMEASRLAARYAGTDVKTAFEDITNAIGTDMPRALKRYGLITREETTQIQTAISAGAKDIDLYSIAMAHAAVNSAKFGEAQTNAAERVQAFHVVVNETRENIGKTGITAFTQLMAASYSIDALGKRFRATWQDALGVGVNSLQLREGASEAIRKRNALLGIQSEEEKKAADVGKAAAQKSLVDAQAALSAEQDRVKTAAEWGKTSSEALKEAERAIKEYEDELKRANEIEAEAIAGREKATQATFDARKALGQTSMQDEISELVRRAELQWQNAAERIAAENAVEKATRDMTDRIFEHEKTLGMQSLQDDINFQKRKAAAAVAGSAERMKAEETVYAKEQELRDKSNSAALGLVGKAVERLKARYGREVVSAEDVTSEIGTMRAEQGVLIGELGQWTHGTGRYGHGYMAGSDLLDAFRAVGEQNAASRAGLGSFSDILSQGAQLEKPLPSAREGLAGMHVTWPTGIDAGYTTAMEAAYSAVDSGLGKIEARVNDSSSKISAQIFGNVEEWFVRKLMGQIDRN